MDIMCFTFAKWCGFLNLQVILEINTLSPRFVYHCATLRLRNQERIWDNDLAKKGFRLFFAVREPLSVVNIAPLISYIPRNTQVINIKKKSKYM